jgi:hypothetical protein
MTWIALKMLTGDRSKYFAILFGVTFASLLITEQSATFCGVMLRTTSSKQRWVKVVCSLGNYSQTFLFGFGRLWRPSGNYGIRGTLQQLNSTLSTGSLHPEPGFIGACQHLV